MFIQDTDLIEIKIYYRKIRNTYAAYIEKEFNKLSTEQQGKCESFIIKARPLTWGLYNELQDKAMIVDANGDKQFNYKIFKENKLKRIIMEWDVMRDGKKVNPDESNISHLAPSIGEAIIRAYDTLALLTEEDEKN